MEGSFPRLRALTSSYLLISTNGALVNVSFPWLERVTGSSFSSYVTIRNSPALTSLEFANLTTIGYHMALVPSVPGARILPEADHGSQ